MKKLQPTTQYKKTLNVSRITLKKSHCLGKFSFCCKKGNLFQRNISPINSTAGTKVVWNAIFKGIFC